MTARYAQLNQIIAACKPREIVEVGTWNGDRAIQMATEALKHRDDVRYWGFDLFEDATTAINDRELNVKKPFPLKVVQKKLEAFQKSLPAGKTFVFSLEKGDTRETLKAMDFTGCDFAYIDGGHSIETVSSDLHALRDVKVIVMDDYYVPDAEGRCPDVTKYGCNLVIEGAPGWSLLPQLDPVLGGGLVQMAVRGVAVKGKANLQIKTKNCVPDEEIQANIRYAVSKGLPTIPMCHRHDRLAVMASGGPSLIGQLAEIRQAQARGGYVVCVKHAHDTLLAAGIVPWACMLLDPRSHVQDFIEDPHPDVLYFVASMCHPSTIDRLIERNARVWMYHAHVGANEIEVLREVAPGSFLVPGGSASATRGISVLHTIGFRRFECFGYDGCYYKKPDLSEKLPDGNPRYYEVEVRGRKFWTDGELVAQAQDFEKLLQGTNNFDIAMHGDGMIPHVCRSLLKLKPFEEFFDGEVPQKVAPG